MLVSMKHEVLTRADQQRPLPKRRGRHVGIVIGVIAVLGIGLGSGAVALGLVPQPFEAAAPSPSPTPTEPPAPSTPAAAPIENTPTATPGPTTTRPAYAPDDPATWTISGDEVGPVALGGDTTAETDDLAGAYAEEPASACPNPDVSLFRPDHGPVLTVTSRDGKVDGVAIGLLGGFDPASLAASPKTAEGAGIGSTIDDLRATYPDLRYTGAANGTTVPESASAGLFPFFTIERGGYSITFELGSDDVHVGMVWVSSDPVPPYEFCG